jgi:ribonuclease M5
MIKESIIVEGRDDEAAVKRAVDAEIIITHGYGIRKETFDLIERAYKNQGVIILTDPDFAGERIRKRLAERFPQAKHAHLSKEEATKDGDVGVENASPENIMEALSKVRTVLNEKRLEFTQDDMINYGLSGATGAADRRDKLGRLLGIGYGNSKIFLARLNHYGVTRKEFIQAWINYTHQVVSGK